MPKMDGRAGRSNQHYSFWLGAGGVYNGFGAVNAFLTARSACQTDNSMVKRLAKDNAKGKVVDTMLDFANSAVRFNKTMVDPAKLVMGIRPKDNADRALSLRAL